MTTEEYAKQKVEEAFVIAEKFFNRTLSRPEKIIFKRSGTTAGYSNFAKKELMFQLDLAEHHGKDFESTYFHEVAHYVDDETYGNKYKNGRRQIHGQRWKYIMTNVYGLAPKRCHSYDVTVTKTKFKRYAYVCDKGHTHNITSTIHNRILKGRKYKCKCGSPIFHQENTILQ